jgi:hypothetical protein
LWHREARAAGVSGGQCALHQTLCVHVGRRCRQASIRDVAKELRLDWDTVKTLEKQYMWAQLERAGTPGPRAIGIDEISVRKGHSYRIVVSDLVRKRPIWFGGVDRSEASMTAFYDWLGLKKSRKIRLAVMDMWKPFRNVTKDKAPQAAILFDKFHIMRHLGEALDKGLSQKRIFLTLLPLFLSVDSGGYDLALEFKGGDPPRAAEVEFYGGTAVGRDRAYQTAPISWKANAPSTTAMN